VPDSIVVWPWRILKPTSVQPNPVAFTRSGGKSLGGLSRNTRTDRGWWSIAYRGVALTNPSQRRSWNMMRQQFGGMAGSVAVPVWSHDLAEWPAGASNGELLSPHSDGSPFSDGSLYSQRIPIDVEMVSLAEIGDTSVTLRLVYGINSLSGIRFSYNHALYETGMPTLISGDEWTLPIFPAIRADIPAGAELEVAMPTCLVKLAADRGMDVSFTAGRFDMVDVAFVEDTAYWNDLAVA